MANELRPQTPPPSDEVDLGQLFRMIGNGFRNLFRAFLRVFLYLKRNMWILGGLVIVGFLIGFALKSITSHSLKTEVIVEPNLDSKGYLYDIVDEIAANLKDKDSTFFGPLGIDVNHLDGFAIEIAPVQGVGGDVNQEANMKYLELLQKFQDNPFVRDVVKEELSKRSTFNHRITFYYTDANTGHKYAEKLMAYINSNPFYSQLTTLNKKNAEERIVQNTDLIKQVDLLIANYSKKMGQEASSQVPEGKIILDNQESLDVPGLFQLKNGLIREIETKRVELLEQNKIITIINFGKTQQVKKVFFGRTYILLPLIFVGLFFLWSFLVFLDRRAKELN